MSIDSEHSKPQRYGTNKLPVCPLEEYGSLTLPLAQISSFWHPKDCLIFRYESSSTVMRPSSRKDLAVCCRDYFPFAFKLSIYSD